MKTHLSKSLFIGTVLFLISGISVAQTGWKEIVNNGDNFYKIKKDVSSHFSKERKSRAKYETKEGNKFDKAEIKYARWQWYWENRVSVDGSFPDEYSAYLDYEKSFENKNKKSRQIGVKAGTWKPISQTTADGGYNGMGRANDVLFHPTDVNTFWVCTDGGGLWKSTDGGSTYTPLTDDLPKIAVSAAAVKHSNPNVLYIGVNEQIYWARTLGVWKSTNGGETWVQTSLGGDYSSFYKTINELAVSKVNNNRVIAATSAGLKVSNNEGSTWSTKESGYFISVKQHPTNDNIMYAAKRGSGDNFYKSTDGGNNWSKVANNGLNGLVVADIQVTPANPNKIGVSAGGKIYISTNGGNDFSEVSDYNSRGVFIISALNANTIYEGYQEIHKSTNNGSSYNQITEWYSSPPFQTVHADQRGVRYNPIQPHMIYWCNDGGVYKLNENNGQFTEHTNGLIVTQFYAMDASQTNDVLIGGTQDNGGRMRRDNGTWRATNGGDAMVCKIDKTNPNILYSTYITGELKRSTNGWSSFQNIYPNKPGDAPAGDDRIKGAWVTPYVLDPSNNNTIVIGYDEVYRSTDRGNNWSVLSNNLTGSYNNKLAEINVAPSNSNVIYASYKNKLYKTTNLGSNWTTYTLTGADNIMAIEIDPENANKLWVSRGGYGDGNRIYESTNGGATFNSISTNLPTYPISDIAYVEGTEDMLIVATDIGPFWKDNTTTQWKKLGDNFPHCEATDVVIQYHTNKVFVSTYGRGIWEASIPGTDTNEKPEVSFENVQDGDVFAAGTDLYVLVNATDDDGVNNLKMYVNGTFLRQENGFPYEWGLAGSSDAVLKNMTEGDYVLRVIATDSDDETSEEIITITIAPVFDLPGKIEGEDFVRMMGVQTEETTDIGGGENVAYIGTGDYTEYYVNVTESGTYKLDYRFASLTTGGDITMFVDNIQASIISEPATGGWQTWVTSSGDVTLTEGSHVVRLLYTGVINLNWFEVSTINAPPTANFVSPLNGEVFTEGEDVTVLVDAQDDVAVGSVDLFIDDSFIRKISLPAYEWNSQTQTDPALSNLSPGNYELRADVYDSDGVKIEEKVSFIINSRPNVSIITPQVGETILVGSSLSVEAQASDSDGEITSGVLYMDGAEVSTITNGNLLWSNEPSLTNMPSGEHSVKVVVTDNYGATQEESVSFMVNMVTSLNSNENSSVSVYPVPVVDVINIEGFSSNEKWQICNVLGEIVFEGSGARANLSELNSGSYILASTKGKLRFVKR